MKKETKKIMAVLMLLLVLINSLPLNAFAAFITDINSNAEFGVVGGSFAEYKHELHYANYDGGTYLLFCTQFGKKSPTGKAYEYGNEFLAEFKANRPEYQHMAEMIYFGYTMNYGMGLPGSYEAKVAAACTQQYVWETLGNAPARDSWNGSYMSSGLYANWLAQTEGYYNQYHSNVSFNGSTNKVAVGANTVLSDSNGVLAHYPSFSYNIGGVIFGHEQGSNDLGINVTSETTAENINFNTRDYGMYELMPNGASYDSGTMSNYVSFEFTSGTIQNMMFSNYIDPSTFSVSVEIESGKLQVRKINAYGNEDIYNVAKSVKFYSKGDLVATRTTNDKGECEDITELPLGKYLVKEDKAPIGYLIDKKEYEVNLVYKDQYTKVITGNANSTDKVKEMRIHIFKSGIKVNSGETPGLAGSIFTIKLNSDVQRAYEQGYTYEEVWSGIDEYGNKVEVDSKRVEQAQAIAPTYEAVETDENGDAYTKELPYGTYVVKETTTPKDYETAEDFLFSITDDESEIVDIAKKVKHIVVNNEQLESYVKLVKKDLKTNKNVTLNSATFKIKVTKDIYDRATKKIIWKKGEFITQKLGRTTYDSFTTNAKNIIVPDNSYNDKLDNLGSITIPLTLPVGSYEIEEIKTPQGFLQLEESVKFKIEGIRNYDKDQDGDPIIEVVVKNEQPTGTLIIDKEIAIRENVDTSLIDTSDLSGIEFKLYAKENIISPIDGSVIYKKGQEVNTYNLDKNGNLKVEELPMGVYEIQETKTLDGLVLNDKKYEVKFEQQDLATKVYEVKLDISNDTTLFEFSKIDVTGDNELPGAKLTITDKAGNVVDEWTSTENKHTIEGLVVGKEYTMTEEIAPDGYVKATSISFKVENTKEVQKVQMIDKLVEVVKTDFVTGEEIEGAELQVVDEEGNIIDAR